MLGIGTVAHSAVVLTGFGWYVHSASSPPSARCSASLTNATEHPLCLQDVPAAGATLGSSSSSTNLGAGAASGAARDGVLVPDAEPLEVYVSAPAAEDVILRSTCGAAFGGGALGASSVCVPVEQPWAGIDQVSGGGVAGCVCPGAGRTRPCADGGRAIGGHLRGSA